MSLVRSTMIVPAQVVSLTGDGRGTAPVDLSRSGSFLLPQAVELVSLVFGKVAGCNIALAGQEAPPLFANGQTIQMGTLELSSGTKLPILDAVSRIFQFLVGTILTMNCMYRGIWQQRPKPNDVVVPLPGTQSIHIRTTL